MFLETAEELIKEKGAGATVAAALAFISGYTEVTTRSLLSAHQVSPSLTLTLTDLAPPLQGYTTLMLTSDKVIYSPGYFWRILEHKFGEEVKSTVKGLRMTQDSKVGQCGLACSAITLAPTAGCGV